MAKIILAALPNHIKMEVEEIIDIISRNFFNSFGIWNKGRNSSKGIKNRDLTLKIRIGSVSKE